VSLNIIDKDLGGGGNLKFFVLSQVRLGN